MDCPGKDKRRPARGIRADGDEIEEYFSDQKQTLKVVLIFTVIAVLLSSLGLLAMSTYYMLQERRNASLPYPYPGC